MNGPTDGRTDDAEVLLAELEKKFPQCYVAVGGLGSGPMLAPRPIASKRTTW